MVNNFNIQINEPSKESLIAINNNNNTYNNNITTNSTITTKEELQKPRTILLSSSSNSLSPLTSNQNNNYNDTINSTINKATHLHPKHYSHHHHTNIIPKKQQQSNLLDDLINKQSSNYRKIKFTSPHLHSPPEKQLYFINKVSFDDMNRRFDDESEPDSDDDVGWDLYNIKRGRIKPKQFKSQEIDINSYLSIGSTTTGGGSGGGARRNSINIDDSKYLSGGRRTSINTEEIKYPRRNSTNVDGELSTTNKQNVLKLDSSQYNFYQSTPISNMRSFSITKQHKLYDKLYNNELLISPVLQNRTILIYISSRIHTWVALDWILKKFIENGDKLIIVSTIDPNIFENQKKDKKKRRKSSITPMTNINEIQFENELDRYTYKSLPENLIQISKNLMSYITNIIDPNLIVKFTVELVAGKTKQVLKDMCKLHEPNLMCIGSKHNRCVGEPVSTFISSKLSGRLIKIFPLPIIVVPAVNMNEFEINLQNEINHTEKTSELKVESPLLERSLSSTTTATSTSNSSNSENEINSIASSITSTANGIDPQPYDSTTIITEKYTDYKTNLDLELSQLQKTNNFDENYYSNIIKTISDNSLNLCSNLITLKTDITSNYESCKIAKLITGSSLFENDKIYSTKSLLEPPVEKKKVIIVPKEHKMSFKEVREQLKQQQQQQQQAQQQQAQQQAQLQAQQQQEQQEISSPTGLKWSLGLEKPIRNYTTNKDRDSSNGSLSIKSFSGSNANGESLSKNSTNSNENVDDILSQKSDQLSKVSSIDNCMNNNHNNSSISNGKISSNGSDKKKKKKFWKLFSK